IFEPEEGKYNFDFFDRIIQIADRFGFKVILGTPTATYPPWLYAKYPDMVQVSKEGIERIIGNRRGASFASKEYWKACEKIVTALAKHYGTNKTVIGWQVDNEPGHEGSDVDYSKNSGKKFKKWLKEKYGTIDKLNEIWGGSFWGLIYNSFDEIPVPGNHVASNFNPAMIQDFYRFNSDLLISFIEMQVDILKRYAKSQFITTNLFPSPFLAVTDMARLSEKLDFISWDNYPVWGSQTEPYPHPFISGGHAYIRGLKNKNFTIMEQISGFQGHDLLGYLPPPNNLSLWLVQAIFHGAERIIFFRYRTARFGQEQLCYGILDHNKKRTDRYFELKKTIGEIQKIADDFVHEEVSADALILHDIDNVRNLKHQPISEGLVLKPTSYANVGYDIEFFTWYSGLNILNIATHVLPTSANIDFSKYKLVVLPIYFMSDESIVEKLENYVASGGTLVLGYRSGIKDKNNWMFDETPPGPFKFLAGLEITEFEVLGKNSSQVKFGFSTEEVGKIAEILKPTSAKVIAKYSDSSKFYDGLPAITENQYHKGKVYYIGTSPSPKLIARIFHKIAREKKISFQFKGRYIEILRRKGINFDYEVKLNHSSKSQWVGLTRLKPFEFKIQKISK
ncbi:MAG: beta-galactosidase, partial [Leptospiraceae bacterium]|nr:beta-galactosidase [Leptospiraceae bacterium]